MVYGRKFKKIICALIGIVFNLSLLAFFKYARLFANLVLQTLSLPEDGIGSFLLNIPLPLGISFYTFEGISLAMHGSHTKKE
jgi:alginate O-acetyltransferase complex protein AlgI